MSNSLSLLDQAFTETGTQLDRIIVAYKRKKPSHPQTIVEYQDGSITEYDIVGKLEYGSISNVELAIKADIGNTVTSIGDDAFFSCTGLMSITIPNSVEGIGEYTFASCSGLTSISFSGKTKTQVQGMSNYPWNLNTGCTIHCADGDILL